MKCPDKSTTSYAMVDFVSDRKFVREISGIYIANP